MDKVISDLLKDLGVSPAYIGYEYLRSSIKFGLEDIEYIRNMNKSLYPALSEKHFVCMSGLARAMDSSIKRAWNIPGVEMQKVMFRGTAHSYTNVPITKEFIATVVDYIQTYMEVDDGSK